MSLGETILRLRGERNLSQGDLAHQLNVSRQSISKWETDSAVPELDKLVKLSSLFGVTLDELVLEEKRSPMPEHEPAATAPGQPQTGVPARKIVGTILLCLGFLVVVLLTVLGSFLGGLVFASPLLVCGIICMVMRHKPGLWCAWAVCFAVDLYLRYATGINWRLTRFTLHFTPEMNYMRLAMAWVQLLCMVLLPGITLLCYRKVAVTLTSRNRVLLIGGWALLAVGLVGSRLWLGGQGFAVRAAVTDWGGLGLFTALFVLIRCSLRTRNAGEGTG